MKVIKNTEGLTIDGGRDKGFVYITPQSTQYWAEIEDTHNTVISNWLVVKPVGSSRIARFFSLIPCIWNLSK